MLTPWKESYDQKRQHSKKQRHYFVNTGLSSQSYGFSSSHMWIWELDCEESWVPKNWCFWTVVLQKTLESRLDCKEIQPVHPKGDQSWVFIEGLMLKMKLQYFGHLMQRDDSFEKTLMLGKSEGRRWRGRQRMRCLDGITYSMDMSWSKLREWWWTGRPGMRQSMGSQDSNMPKWFNWKVVQWLRLHALNVGGLGSIPGQGTRSHMPQLRVHMPQITACCS